jgi:RTX calcium-binding nonapeptide repeat (4 copies)
MKVKTLCFMFVVLAMLATTPLELSARTLGMVADNATNSVTVFDADTHAILGTVPIPPSFFIGDVLITPDLKLGFVSNINPQVHVVDLTTSPPSLAAGTNPIPSSTNFGMDLSISPDGKFLIMTNAGVTEPVPQPVSVIDIAARAEVSTLFTDYNFTSSDVCSDSSVLVTTIPRSESSESDTVRRFILSGTGTLTDTGDVLSIVDPFDVYCAPGVQSGVTITFFGGVTSFSIPGLAEVDSRSFSGNDGISGAVNPAGNRVFMRSNNPGSIDVFDFNSATGALGPSPLLTFSVGSSASAFFGLGIDQIALHPNGEKLFVSEPNALNVYDPNTGALLDSITDPAIVAPTGVTVVTEADPCAGDPPPGAIVGTNGPNQINGTSGNDKIFGLGGSDQINGGGGNDLICGGTGNDQLNGNAGNDTIIGGPDTDQITGGPGSDTCIGDPGDTLSSCNP